MNKDELKFLRKYLQGHASPAEEAYVKRWLSENENNADVQAILQEEWIHTSSDAELDMEEAWTEFTQKAGIDTLKRGKRLRGPIPSKPYTRRRLLAIASMSLAVVLVTLVSMFLFLPRNGHDSSLAQEATYSLKKTNRGEKLNISLPDGSFIKLNSSTELRIPHDYSNGDERIVYLEGEAFFEVARDESKPFKVITGGVTTEVLGTSFNVSTFHSNEETNVAVVTGKVRVANERHEIILRPAEMTSLSSSTDTPVKEAFNEDLVTGWRNNLLIFDKVSFEEIIERIEQWYGVEFVIEGEPQQTGKYSGRFENKSLPWVLEGLGFSSAFEYRIVDKTVYLNFK